MDLTKALLKKFDSEDNVTIMKISNYIRGIAKRVLTEQEFRDSEEYINKNIQFKGNSNILIKNIEYTNMEEAIYSFINLYEDFNLVMHQRIIEGIYENMNYLFVVIPNSLNLFKCHVFRSYTEAENYIQKANIIMYKLQHIEPMNNIELIKLNSMFDNLYKIYFKNKDDRKKDVIRDAINKTVNETIV